MVAHDEASGLFLDGPGRREATRSHGIKIKVEKDKHSKQIVWWLEQQPSAGGSQQ
jgi:hypothetical protein